MKKKIVLMVMVSTLLLSGIPVFATSSDEVQSEQIVLFRLKDIEEMLPLLSVSGTTATYRVTARGAAHVTSMSASLQIQKRNSNGTYSDFGNPWMATSASNYLLTSGTKTVDSGGTYRLKVKVTPYINGIAGTAETAYIVKEL